MLVFSQVNTYGPCSKKKKKKKSYNPPLDIGIASGEQGWSM